MVTTAEIAASITEASSKLDLVFTNSGWNKTVPMSQTFGGPVPAVSLGWLIDYAASIAARIQILQKVEMDRDGLGAFLTSIPDQFNMLNVANLGQNPPAAISGFLVILQAIAWRLPPSVPSITVAY